jgi:predicted Rdx family selenoprotein
VAAEIAQACGHEAELIAGSGGIFDICVAGSIIFSKAESRRFPRPGEITTLLKKLPPA